MKQIRVIRMVHDQQREMLDRKSRHVEHRIVSFISYMFVRLYAGKSNGKPSLKRNWPPVWKMVTRESNGFPRRPTITYPICKPSVNATKNAMGIITKRFWQTNSFATGKICGILLNVEFACPNRSLDIRRKWLILLFWNSNWLIIVGKFGQCKRHLGLGQVMAQHKDSSETAIAITILTANLTRWEQEAARLLFLSALAM